MVFGSGRKGSGQLGQLGWVRLGLGWTGITVELGFGHGFGLGNGSGGLELEFGFNLNGSIQIKSHTRVSE